MIEDLITIQFQLTGEEARAMRILCALEERRPPNQARYVLRNELMRRGLLDKDEIYPNSPPQQKIINNMPKSGPQQKTIRKIAMVRKIRAIWQFGKVRACKCVGIKLTTYNRYDDYTHEFESYIRQELALLKRYKFAEYLNSIQPDKRESVKNMYDNFMASLT